VEDDFGRGRSVVVAVVSWWRCVDEGMSVIMV